MLSSHWAMRPRWAARRSWAQRSWRNSWRGWSRTRPTTRGSSTGSRSVLTGLKEQRMGQGGCEQSMFPCCRPTWMSSRRPPTCLLELWWRVSVNQPSVSNWAEPERIIAGACTFDVCPGTKLRYYKLCLQVRTPTRWTASWWRWEARCCRDTWRMSIRSCRLCTPCRPSWCRWSNLPVSGPASASGRLEAHKLELNPSSCLSLLQICCACFSTLCTTRTWSKRRPSTSGSPAKTPPSSWGKAWPSSPSPPSSRGYARPMTSLTTARVESGAGGPERGQPGGFREVWISKNPSAYSEKKKKNSSTGRDCILDRTFDHISFSVFFWFFFVEGVSFFLFPNRMSFFK